jgi:predicted ATP-grasp superfamily ATP-dependent carboligase
MRDAVAADFARIPGVAVSTLDDLSVESEPTAFRQAARDAEFTLVIAPEFERILEERARWVHEEGGELLGPSCDAIRLTADKSALADCWRNHGVPTPATSTREPTPCEVFPVVWKPLDGCGSTATFQLRNHFDLASARAIRAAEGHAGPMILQQFVPGVAASVALLIGAAGVFPLVPCFQHLSDDGRFQYLGGELPIPPDLAERAVRLATKAVECVPGLRGYVGVDLVLGETADGSQDYAIEINPRLTTSYVGLREAADFNIAEALLRVATGDHPGPMRWQAGTVRFTAAGVN